jgi:mannan endo-1,4-beta-mannosidase
MPTHRLITPIIALTAVFVPGTGRLAAIEPANPNLIPAAREVLAYLESIYGKQTLLGQNKVAEAEEVRATTGKSPALVSVDLSGWNRVKWSDKYRQNLDRGIRDLARLWHDEGCLVSLEWHWGNPLGQAGTYAAARRDFLPTDVGLLVTPGTPEHARLMADLRRHADFLDNLTASGVPVLWRPLHEIDGGWFWWTDTQTPENTAALWRLMYDYFVNERKLHNLIWVYSAALKAGPHGKDVEAIDYRRRFYPGAKYVDIAGIDIYVNAWYGWEDYRTSGYQRAFDLMQQVAPGKMLALTECEGIPDGEILRTQGPKWLYCLPWYVGNKGHNPPDWVRQCYSNDYFVTRENLPKWTAGERPGQP